MSKRNELAEWREKMASGGFATCLDAGIALDRIARRRMNALAEAYDELRERSYDHGDEYMLGTCDAQSAILRAVAGAGY